jgi:hypothetical protein
MRHGGKRRNAGRPKGKPNSKTLERLGVQAEFNQRVMGQADALFNAQFSLAVGSIRIFRIDEDEDKRGKVKRIHTLVTDPDEIKEVLDENGGSSGIVGKRFYNVVHVPPDNKAIDSMLNRALGKPIYDTEHDRIFDIQTRVILPKLSEEEEDFLKQVTGNERLRIEGNSEQNWINNDDDKNER